MELRENERIDDLEYKDLKIIQNEKGFCFGIDSVLISDFTRDVKSNSIGVDLGTGTGIISILLAAKTNLRKIIGIEVQKEVADMAKRSVELNNLQDKIEIINLNIKDILEDKEVKNRISKNIMKDNNTNVNSVDCLTRETFDFVVTNPPYKKLETGKTNESEYKYISRHEVTADLEDFIEVSKYLLKDKGAFYMVNKPERLAEIINLFKKCKIEPKKLRLVYPKINNKPNLILIKGVKNAKSFLEIERPLIIYNADNTYTDEILKIYNKK